MVDIRIVQIKSPFDIALDWMLTPMQMLDETQELATAVIVALGTDRLALVDDVLPDLDSVDRKGWWGDLDAEVIWGGWTIGVRTWLLTRAKITGPEDIEGSTVARAEFYVREALRPFIERRVASRVDVLAERVGLDRIDVQAVIFRGPLPSIELRYQLLWIEQRDEAAIEHALAGNLYEPMPYPPYTSPLV